MAQVTELYPHIQGQVAGIALPAACKDVVIAADIIATIATADIDAGAIEFVVWYRPISEGSALVAA